VRGADPPSRVKKAYYQPDPTRGLGYTNNPSKPYQGDDGAYA